MDSLRVWYLELGTAVSENFHYSFLLNLAFVGGFEPPTHEFRIHRSNH